MPDLANIKIFSVLQEGDGTRLNPLKLSWGKLLKQQVDEKDNTLTRKVVKVFSFLFKIVLKSIVNEDVAFTQTADDRQSAVVIKER